MKFRVIKVLEWQKDESWGGLQVGDELEGTFEIIGKNVPAVKLKMPYGKEVYTHASYVVDVVTFDTPLYKAMNEEN